jgi:hypothetical protein
MDRQYVFIVFIQQLGYFKISPAESIGHFSGEVSV